MNKTNEAVIEDWERQINLAKVYFPFFPYLFISISFSYSYLIFPSLFSYFLYFLCVSSRNGTINFYEMENRYLPRWWVSSSMRRCSWWRIEKSHKSRSNRLCQMHPPHILPNPQIRHLPLSTIRSPLHPSLQPHSLKSKIQWNRQSQHPIPGGI